MIKAGDRVKCIYLGSHVRIKIGKIYLVEEIIYKNNETRLKILNDGKQFYDYLPKHFELVRKKSNTPKEIL